MIEKIYYTLENLHKLFTFLIALIVLALLTGCVTSGNYGKTKRDRELDNMFLRYEVLPDHYYYTTGGYDRPDAILALHKQFVLDNSDTYWRYIPNVDTAQMRKWIDTIAPEQNYKSAYFAAYILDPNGKKVGAWFSYEAFPTIKFLEGNFIQVYTPDPEPELQFRNLRRGRGL